MHLCRQTEAEVDGVEEALLAHPKGGDSLLHKDRPGL